MFKQPFCGHEKNRSDLLKKIVDNGVDDWILLLLGGAITTFEVKLREPRAAGEPPPPVAEDDAFVVFKCYCLVFSAPQIIGMHI